MITNIVTGVLSSLSEDSFVLDDRTLVIISCPSRKGLENTGGFNNASVSGILASPLNLSAHAEFQSIRQIGGIGQVLSSIDGIVTAVGGQTIQQPWFDRAYWKSTAPLEFTANIKFVAQENAYLEVYKPCVFLISLLYPRVGNEASATVKSYIPPGPNLYSGFDGKGKASGGLLGGAGASDYVEFKFGNMIHLLMCYLKDVEVNFSTTLDSTGYPHAANVTVHIRSFDNNFVAKDGKFQLTDYKPIALNVGMIGDILSGTANLIGAGFKNVAGQLQDLGKKFVPNAR